MKRVAVTGIGVISPIGNCATQIYENAYFGRSGIQLLDVPYAYRLKAPLAAMAKFNGADYFEPPKLRMLDRVSQFALIATNQALADANCDLNQIDRSRIGVFVGTGMGGSQTNDEGYKTLYGDQSDRIKPFTVLLGMHNAPAAWIGIEHDISGPTLTYSTACSSSTVAIGEAWLRVASGNLDIAIAGGSESPLSLGSLKAWEALQTLASIDKNQPSASCKPFSKNRTGMVIGEGAAILVLESWESAVARGIPIHGEILGYGLSTDASHITRPSVEGQAATMRAALKSANINISDIDAINAHGTGTFYNDLVETNAIKAVFGAYAYDLPISATKALHGHLLGAAGALECLLALLAIKHSIALPTMHLNEQDQECDLDYVPNIARENVSIKTMLTNSFAFGGTNAVLALGAGTKTTN